MNKEGSNTFGSFNLGGFGSNLPSTSTTKPLTSNATAAPATNESTLKAMTPAANIQPSGKDTVNSQTTSKPSTVKVIAQSEKEGMATRFEDAYLRVCKDIKKLSEIQKELSQVILKGEQQSVKTVEHLKDSTTKWELTDVESFGKLIDSLIKNIQDNQLSIENRTKSVHFIVAETEKFINEREDIKAFLTKSLNERMNDRSNNRKLDAETKRELDLLEVRVDAFNTMVNELEFNVLENVKRSKIQEEGLWSYYSFNKKISELQNELQSKDKKVFDLEEKMARIKLANASRKAHQTFAGFSCVDLSDSEEEEMEEEEKKDISAAIQYTKRHIRRFNFLNALYETTSQREPLSFNKQE
ncbi:hypothetical protein G6F33_004632 [Rhizopus arrhizus]|nr:hypothetical protein G6F24_007540 [Rhizopus arrhizus]KAG0914012.1 hypothetical protein G6F33_004632 [Rhizopus arrhizus]KAG0944455.1 hypothetical protein G6F32_007342 [Rhizopus arrhizus]